MAFATKDTVTLTLTNDEAQQLTNILAIVGGAMDGPRRHAEAVLDALREAGFDWPDNVGTEVFRCTNEFHRAAIYYND